jgi:hypothetical protein
MGARKQQYRINGLPVGEALYAAHQAARPAILRYVRGEGPRPDDASMWFTTQDRDALRRLHAKGIARDDQRYFDALIEAAIAGDRLSKKETKELAEHVRVMDDGFYPAMQNRASELSEETRGLGHTVSVLQPRAKLGDKTVDGGRSGGNATATPHNNRRKQWEKDLRDHYHEHPLTRRNTIHAEAGRLLGDSRVPWEDPPRLELLRKTILPSLLRLLFPRFYS